MKIRTGFVSNSSSSSFCIYGICEDPVELGKRLWKKAKSDPKAKEELRKIIKDLAGSSVNNDEGLQEWIESGDFDLYQVVEAIGLEGSDGGSDGASLYVGWGWQTIKDDETGKQFKDKVEALIERYFGKGLKYGTYMEGWYN